MRKVKLQSDACFNVLFLLKLEKFFRISPRPISIRQLHVLLHLHPEPINLVVFKGSY